MPSCVCICARTCFFATLHSMATATQRLARPTASQHEVTISLVGSLSGRTTVLLPLTEGKQAHRLPSPRVTGQGLFDFLRQGDEVNGE